MRPMRARQVSESWAPSRSARLFVAPTCGRLPGVGKVTEAKLKHLEIQTVVDLRRVDLLTLEGRLGRYGVRLYELARESTRAK